MYKNKKFLALIPARGGSKGIPGKNLIDLGGRPLITWTIEAGLSSKYIDRLIISSDDENIMKVGEKMNCEVPFKRPAELACDTTSSMEVILHALSKIDEVYDFLILLQPTSPFRNSRHIDNAIKYCIDQNYSLLVSVSRTKKHPYLMFKKDSDNLLTPIMNEVREYNRRQDLEPIYNHNGAIYISDINYIYSKKSFRTLEAHGIILEDYYDIDLDDLDDLEYAQYIYQTKICKKY